MIYDYFRVTGAHDTVLDYADLLPITLRNDDVQEFDARWDEILLSVTKIPTDDILESLYKLRKRESAQLKTVLKLYNMEILPLPIYQKLKTKVKRSTDQKLRLRNFDARHERIEKGAVVKNRNGMNGVEGGKGTCYQWKEEGQCSKGDPMQFPPRDREQKPEHTAATPSEPSWSRGRSVSKKRSIQGKSNHGAILRQPCRYYLKGTCTRSPCEYWHPPECQFFLNETGCKAGDKCLFPHYKVDEQPKKKAEERLPLPQEKRKRRQERCGYCENCTTIGLRLARLVCVGFSKRQTVPGKPAKCLAIHLKSTVHSVCATSSKYPEKEALGKFQSKNLISNVPTEENRSPS